MENKIIVWAVILVFTISILFNLGDLTGNIAKSGTSSEKTPVLTVLTPIVKAGNYLQFKANNVRSGQEFHVFYPNERFTGFRFDSSRGECKFSSAGYYNCRVSYQIPISALPDGNYYIQTKSEAAGKTVGNKAFFTIANSQYQKTGR